MDLAHLQDVIDRTYGERDRERGVPSTVAWWPRRSVSSPGRPQGQPRPARARVRRRARLGGVARQPARRRPHPRGAALRRRVPTVFGDALHLPLSVRPYDGARRGCPRAAPGGGASPCRKPSSAGWSVAASPDWCAGGAFVAARGRARLRRRRAVAARAGVGVRRAVHHRPRARRPVRPARRAARRRAGCPAPVGPCSCSSGSRPSWSGRPGSSSAGVVGQPPRSAPRSPRASTPSTRGSRPRHRHRQRRVDHRAARVRGGAGVRGLLNALGRRLLERRRTGYRCRDRRLPRLLRARRLDRPDPLGGRPRRGRLRDRRRRRRRRGGGRARLLLGAHAVGRRHGRAHRRHRVGDGHPARLHHRRGHAGHVVRALRRGHRVGRLRDPDRLGLQRYRGGGRDARRHPRGAEHRADDRARPAGRSGPEPAPHRRPRGDDHRRSRGRDARRGAGLAGGRRGAHRAPPPRDRGSRRCRSRSDADDPAPLAQT